MDDDSIDIPVKRGAPTAEHYSPSPEPQSGVPTLEELENTRQAALLMRKPTDTSAQAAMVNMAAVLGLIIQGKSEKQIAELTGLDRGQVRLARRALKERGLLGDEVKRALDRLTHEALPLAIDNVIEKLESGSEKYTDRMLDTMGLGGSVSGSGHGTPAAPMAPTLTLNFNLPPGVTAARANLIPPSGKVIGRGKDQPKELTADEHELNTIEMPADPPDGT